MRKIFLVTAGLFISVLSGLAVLAWTAFSQEARPAAADSCLSIPACAFQEENNSGDFARSDSLAHSSGSTIYYAPVVLPQGSTIKKILLICKDNYFDDVVLTLYRQNRSHTSTSLGVVQSSGIDSAWRMFSSSAISPRTVNNFRNSYYVKLDLQGSLDYTLSQVKVFFDKPL